MEATPREVLICKDTNGREPFNQWLMSLDLETRARIRIRLRRAELGNLGEWKSVGDGVSELVIDFGPGYRVYFGQKSNEIHVISGGSKRTQPKDIAAAKKFWRTYEP